MNLHRIIAKGIFLLKKYSPEIKLAIGAAATVGSMVSLYKATTKIDELRAKEEEDIARIDERAAKGEEDYTEEDAANDRKITHSKTVVDTAKTLVLPIALSALGMGCNYSAFRTLKNRNISQAMAYADLLNRFRTYKAAVEEAMGTDEEAKLMNKEEKIAEIDATTGEVKHIVNKKPFDAYGPYCEIFDECTSSLWEKCGGGYNYRLLLRQQSYANRKLRMNGYLFLNDVLDMLGIEKTTYGQTVGWIYAPDDPEHADTSFVSFGLDDLSDPRINALVSGEERSVLLNFNCYGNILNCMNDDEHIRRKMALIKERKECALA